MKTLIAMLLLTSNAFALIHSPDQHQKITDSNIISESGYKHFFIKKGNYPLTTSKG